MQTKPVAIIFKVSKKGETMAEQRCPICQAEVKPSQRYPNYVCNACQVRMVDENNHPIHFHNTDVFGKVEPVSTAFIDGVEVNASEAHFGGIVIRPKKPSPFLKP